MCFFEQARWTCGFWRWGTFRQQCTKEYRTGETCGLKLVYSTDLKNAACGIYRQIGPKERRMEKITADVERWKQEENRKATIEKTERDIDELNRSISILRQRHFERQFDLTALGNGSQIRLSKKLGARKRALFDSFQNSGEVDENGDRLLPGPRFIPYDADEEMDNETTATPDKQPTAWQSSEPLAAATTSTILISLAKDALAKIQPGALNSESGATGCTADDDVAEIFPEEMSRKVNQETGLNHHLYASHTTGANSAMGRPHPGPSGQLPRPHPAAGATGGCAGLKSSSVAQPTASQPLLPAPQAPQSQRKSAFSPSQVRPATVPDQAYAPDRRPAMLASRPAQALGPSQTFGPFSIFPIHPKA